MSQAPLDALPNEILLSVLSSLPSPTLPPLAGVSRRFHAVVLRTLCHRMIAAARLPGHNLVLECYHPSAKTSTPYMLSQYLGTDGLDDVGHMHTGGGPRLAHDELTLGELGGLYSRFRPVLQDEARRPRARYPRRSSQQQHPSQQQAQLAREAPEPDAELPHQDIHLEEGESFTQLCTLTNLGKLGPRHGIYLSHVNVSDSVLRVWRDWLSTRAAADSESGDKATKKSRAGTRTGTGTVTEDSAIIWADAKHNVGVRFRVVELLDNAADVPVLRRAEEEDPPVAYRLEYLELLVRTRKLLLAMEESEVMQTSNSGAFYINPTGARPQSVQALFWADMHLATPAVGC